MIKYFNYKNKKNNLKKAGMRRFKQLKVSYSKNE